MQFVIVTGLEWTNPDIEDNYSSEGSWDLNSGDPDPMPLNKIKQNHHGTRCAGEIAAVANSYCGVGVAYGAKIAGIRLLDGPMTDGLEAQAFMKNMDINDIYSCRYVCHERTIKLHHVLVIIFRVGLHLTGLEIRGILVANATMFSHLLPGFSCGSKHLLLP